MLEKVIEPVESQPNGIEYLNSLRGTALRNKAMKTTMFRDNYSPVLGFSIALDDGTIPALTIANTAFTGYLEHGDISDGKDARKGAELLGEEPTVEGGEADHKADKKKFFSQIIGLCIRTLIHEKDAKQAAVFASVGMVQGLRDNEMQKERNLAMDHGIKANARNLGKWKAWANGVGNGIHTFTPIVPEQYRPIAKRVGNISLGIGTSLSLAALIDMKLHVRRELHDRTTPLQTVEPSN